MTRNNHAESAPGPLLRRSDLASRFDAPTETETEVAAREIDTRGGQAFEPTHALNPQGNTSDTTGGWDCRAWR